jgi:hypothetical protein
MTQHSVKNGPSTTTITKHTVNNGVHTTHQGPHFENNTQQVVNTRNNQYLTTQNGSNYIQNVQNNEIQSQNQMSQNSIKMQEEYKLEPQTPWGGPQKQSIDVSSDKYKLDDAAILAKILYIKTRKQFAGNESSRSIFAMFVWCARHRDKCFFKRLFDYTNWQIFDINESRLFSTHETSIVESIVSSHFVYAMNLLLETKENIRLSPLSFKQLTNLKTALQTL